MSEQNTPRRKTKTGAEIDALLREGVAAETRRHAEDSGGRVASGVSAALRRDAGLRRRTGNDGLEAWMEDEGRIPRWFIGAAAAAVLAIVGWIGFGPSGQPTAGSGVPGETIAGPTGAPDDSIMSMPERFLEWSGADRWADAEPLRREARALMGVAGELAGRVISGVPAEFLRSTGAEDAPAVSGEPT